MLSPPADLGLADRSERQPGLGNHRERDETRHESLAVEPQEVVLGQVEAADWRLVADTAMGPMPVVARKPSRQFGCAFG